MDPRHKHKFLQDTRKDWNGLQDEHLCNLEVEDRHNFRLLEQRILDEEYTKLCDLILNCDDKYQFAKTYQSAKNELENPRNIISPDSAPSVPPSFASAMEKSRSSIGKLQLDGMALWFWLRWGRDPHAGGLGTDLDYKHAIESVAYPKFPGCVTLLLALLSICTFTTFSVLILVRQA